MEYWSGGVMVRNPGLSCLEFLLLRYFVLLWLRVFVGCANFWRHETFRIRILLPPRRQERQVQNNISLFFAAFASLREILRFFWLRLCRAGIFATFVVNVLFLFGCGSAALDSLRLNHPENKWDGSRLLTCNLCALCGQSSSLAALPHQDLRSSIKLLDSRSASFSRSNG